ncbi:MAG: hypothetical protein B6U85_06805 [Desulfurococcales archaeon ex4484_42]|nr:MAG: hypothetical protein B6U85_06805 [Desulfurococcales archaeon ex4484_42]
MGGKSVISEGIINFVGKITNISRSVIPNVSIIEISGPNISMKMDLVKDLWRVKVGDKVEVLITREKPSFEKGKDFVAHGHIVTKRKESDVYKLLISLWGFLVILISKDKSLHDTFGYVDKVYVKMRKV